MDYHFEKFHLPYLKWFKDQGWEVHVAAKGNLTLPFVDKKYEIDIQRSPFSVKNLRAYKQLKSIIEANHFQIIHCHTPMGGALSRLAAREVRREGTKVIYTAHGFHFYKGAPFLNWLFYFPIEKWLAHYTDCLIAINQEDYHLARTLQFKAGCIKHVHGVGVDTKRFCPINEQNKASLRKSFGYSPDDFLIVYVAEFNKNKNQQLLIHLLSSIKHKLPRAKLLLVGDGKLLETSQVLAKKLAVTDHVDFLGYLDDVLPYLQISDIAVGSSLREGLPVNIMEAMSCSLPIVASDNRGHRELIQNGETGWIETRQLMNSMADKIIDLAIHYEKRKRFGQLGQQLVETKYSTDVVKKEMSQIYTAYMVGGERLTWALQ